MVHGVFVGGNHEPSTLSSLLMLQLHLVLLFFLDPAAIATSAAAAAAAAVTIVVAGLWDTSWKGCTVGM